MVLPAVTEQNAQQAGQERGRLRGQGAAGILGFATQGAGGNEEQRLRGLLSRLPTEIFRFERRDKLGCFWRILRRLRGRRYKLAVMEGSGTAGGLALLLGRWLYGSRYVVSSGDAIAPFLAARWPWTAPIFEFYERLLYRNCSGFIGWTPYLVGRALTMGARRAVTAGGWAEYRYTPQRLAQSRAAIRSELGIPLDAIVFGIVGSLRWSRRVSYCYGLELVRAALEAAAPQARVLVVGDGDGRARLRDLAGEQLGRTIFLPGRVEYSRVPDYLAAMDVGSLPQSVDAVGSFRYTTKVSEYFSLRLPYVTNRIPAGYDLDYGGLWRLPGDSPWDARFVASLAGLMRELTREAVEKKRAAIPACLPEFCRNRQIDRVTQFLQDILGDEPVAG